jgi:hypothetical protein
MESLITLDQRRSKTIVGRHCCATIITAHSARMAEDATMTLRKISARMTKETIMSRDHISARTTCVMWYEERLWNAGVLQRVRLSNLVQ